MLILGKMNDHHSPTEAGKCGNHHFSTSSKQDPSYKSVMSKTNSVIDVMETTTKTSNMTISDPSNEIHDDMITSNDTAITSNGVVHVDQLYDKPLTQFDPELEIQIKVILHIYLTQGLRFCIIL